MYTTSSVRFDTMSGHNQKLSTYSQIELSVSARKLINRDITSKSDPQCILYIRHGLSDKFIEIGRTEVIKDNLNPDWIKKFDIQFKFNESQLLKFELWDFDPISGNEFLGQIAVELGAILAKNGGTYQQKLTTGGRQPRRFGGELLIRAEELSANKQIALISFSASNLDKKDFLGKSDPYLTLSRSNPDSTYSVVHKTEVIKNTLNPQWRPFNIKAQQLCGGDYERSIKVDCYDWDENSAHDLIGTFVTNLKRLSAGSSQNTYELINEEKKKRKGKSYTNSGVVKLNSISITQEVTFIDYIRGGTQMHFAVAVDFTASNGDPRDPRSLHFLDYSGRPNQYEIALRSVGEVIRSYDTQGLFPSYGFGAKLPTGHVSHMFPLNNNTSHPYCRGIEEIIGFYKSTLNAITLHGPTNFAPVINNTTSIAQRFQDGKHYFILLIITDGVISDMSETIDAIVNASTLPLSIIIIGVGNADFSAMDFLDGDGTTIVSRGRRAVRDIVQFVPLNRYVNSNWQQNQFELGRAVLAEIPTQFLQFMNSKGFKPSPPGQGSVQTGIFPEPTGNESTPIYPSIPSEPNQSHFSPTNQKGPAPPPPSTFGSYGTPTAGAPYPPNTTSMSYPNIQSGNPYPPNPTQYPPGNPYPPTTTA
ncbi:copine-9-like [Oppia nitens]|uniref:copine-9-like n=1 Tax=Oppia nitens TaxID=1686743 RepID=UPI0023DA841A|nr:copine-9-like [Oppia nitens]